MSRRLWGECLVICALVVVVAGMFVLVYFDSEEAKTTSWETVTYRVMDSMLPFQQRFHTQHGRFAFGVRDRAIREHTITVTTGWQPSITDSNRYTAHVVGNNAYKVIAISTTNETLCRMYPSKVPCFDMDSLLKHGL